MATHEDSQGALALHQDAELHPFMDEEALEALVEDIVAHGQRQPIYCYQEPIIDGHNRYLACRRAGIEPWIRRARGD
jgi:ParB-like chromosome segregation protein Spo0J